MEGASWYPHSSLLLSKAMPTLAFSSPQHTRERNTLQRAHFFCLKSVTEDGWMGEWQSQKKTSPHRCQARAPAANCNSVCRQSVQQTRTCLKHRICPALFPSIVYCSPPHPRIYHPLQSSPILYDSFLSIASPPQVFFDKSQRCNSWSPFKTSTCLCCHLGTFLSSSLIFFLPFVLFYFVSTNSLHSLVLLSSLFEVPTLWQLLHIWTFQL